MSHLISTPTKPATCPRCHQPTLVAHDNGIPARIDPTPLDRQAEIAALLAGKWTYTLTRYGSLIQRDADQIANPTIRGTIHADHKCDRQTHTQEGLF